ncbi:hypothetical protein B0I37DRAFT_376298 [Chaetomium sp. MPI-CAGE-AT-0009]|nr:hypothetical protein B0I37DRAFT_376298 [Chaetomium sp. MPI-CAGE-AT-0009]
MISRVLTGLRSTVSFAYMPSSAAAGNHDGSPSTVACREAKPSRHQSPCHIAPWSSPKKLPSSGTVMGIPRHHTPYLSS